MGTRVWARRLGLGVGFGLGFGLGSGVVGLGRGWELGVWRRGKESGKKWTSLAMMILLEGVRSR